MKKNIIFTLMFCIFAGIFIFDVQAKSILVRVQIDDPVYSQEKQDKMKIRGWVMSDLKDRTVEVYIDGEKIDNVEK